MRLPRASGILLHPTSLPGRFGIGDLGEEAFRFIDFLDEAGQSYWQILPLVPTGWGDSPYSSASAFAGNTLLISPQNLVGEGLLSPEQCETAPEFPVGRVDYGRVYEWKRQILAEAYEAFLKDRPEALTQEFEAFAQSNSWWLDDHAAFQAIKTDQNHRPWYEWPDELKLRDGDALRAAGGKLAREIDTERFCQFLFFRQWMAVRSYANEAGIKIIGDMPIFVALDSADVWCNREMFKLNDDGTPRVVSGVPPDYFSSTGQLWGNPIYDWDAMRANRFGWWAARTSHTLASVDIIRVDHFIGLSRMWEVPGGDKTAENGQWVDVPGDELLNVLAESLNSLPFIAEDLGALTPQVEELRDRFDLPGMRILEYAFGGDPRDQYLPHNYVRNCVAYTGTHDNDTAVGWYRSTSKEQRGLCRRYLNANGREMHWTLIRGVMASIADTAIIPMQDLLGLDSSARMNTPAKKSGNWQWRLRESEPDDDVIEKLRELTHMYGRQR